MPFHRRNGAPPTVWRRRAFRRLWYGQTVSRFGSMVGEVALPLVAILLVHASTLEVGILAACERLPFLLIGLPAGAWVDRWVTRRVLIVADVARFAVVATIPLAALWDGVSIGQLFAVALVAGSATVFFEVGYQAYLPELVPDTQLVEANAKLGVSEALAQIAGPGLGGVLIQVLTAPFAMLIDAVTYLWSAACVLTIPRARSRSAPPTPREPLWRAMGAGVRFVARDRVIRALTAATTTLNFFFAISLALYYVLLARTLDLSATVIGLIAAVGSVGALIAAPQAGRLARRVGVGPAIWIPALVAPLGLLITPFVHRDATLLLLALGQMLWAACLVTYNIGQISLRQQVCPAALLGRMTATVRVAVWGAMPIGSLAGGLLGTWLGLRPALLIAAIGSALAVIPLLLSPVRGMRVAPARPGTDRSVAVGIS